MRASRRAPEASLAGQRSCNQSLSSRRRRSRLESCVIAEVLPATSPVGAPEHPKGQTDCGHPDQKQAAGASSTAGGCSGARGVNAGTGLVRQGGKNQDDRRGQAGPPHHESDTKDMLSCRDERGSDEMIPSRATVMRRSHCSFPASSASLTYRTSNTKSSGTCAPGSATGVCPCGCD